MALKQMTFLQRLALSGGSRNAVVALKLFPPAPRFFLSPRKQERRSGIETEPASSLGRPRIRKQERRSGIETRCSGSTSSRMTSKQERRSGIETPPDGRALTARAA